MKKLFGVIAFIVMNQFNSVAQSGKFVSDCTIFFNITAEGSEASPAVAKTMEGATRILYVKGSKSRSDLITNSFKQTTLTDSKTDSTVILRELGSTKYISYLDDNSMKAKNKKYEGTEFANTSETKTILGYDCKKAVAKLAGGTAYNIFYTTSIIPSNKQYEYQFKSLPGFVLEYEEEAEDGKAKIKYSASKISLLSVPAATFDIPKTGYRIL